MPVRRGHLRLVGDDEVALRRRHDLVMLRRRMVAVAVLVMALVGMGLALSRAATVSAGSRVDGAGASLGAGAGAPTPVLPIARAEYVVQPGDTLWKIARALQPEGDVRPLVYQLGEARDGAPLRVGERITLP